MKITIELASIAELLALKQWLGEIQVANNDIALRELNLMPRTINCLAAEDIFTVRDLAGRTYEDLLKTPNLGRKALNELCDTLKAHGFPILPREPQT